MIINNFSVKAEGYVSCESDFYSALDILHSEKEHSFHSGLNILKGEIDSGVWGISYLLSMYQSKNKKFILEYEPEIVVNNSVQLTIQDFLPHTCYIDLSYPLFTSKKSVKTLILNGINKNKLNYTIEQIVDLFSLTYERINRSIKVCGNEKINAMAAVAFCHNKQVFCFPWMSKKRFEAFHRHIPDTLNALEQLNKIILLPKGTEQGKTGDGSLS